MKRGLLALLAGACLLAGCASANSTHPAASQVASAGHSKSPVTGATSEFDYAFDEQQAAVHPVKAEDPLGIDDGDCACQLHPHKVSTETSQAKSQ